MPSPQMTSDVLALSAVEQAALVRHGDLSARELVEAALERIERRNPTLGAFVHLCTDRALAEADAIRPGDPRPLCGVPIGLKDLLSAADGLPASEGTAALRDGVADHDSAHVRRLREAGAIILGKTNPPELGLRPVTENARFGPTRTPWDERLSPGGSSGGSAAAVAAGMVGLADGSDMGGSIRIPAACWGVVGRRPSRGRVSMGPDFGAVGAGVPVDSVLTRTVRDTATALDAIAGYEPGDHHQAPELPISFVQAARRPPAPVLIRVALSAPLGVPIDGEPRDAARRAAHALADLGHDIRDDVPDWDDEAFPSSWETFATGALQHIVRVLERLHGRAVDPERLEPATRGWLIDSAPVTLVDYLEAAERLWSFSRRILSSWPKGSVLVTPTLTRLPAAVGGLQSQAGVTDDGVRFSTLVRIWGVTGQPAISLPIHQTADGVPVGVQLIGPPGRDDLLLALAAQLGRSRARRPILPAGG